MRCPFTERPTRRRLRSRSRSRSRPYPPGQAQNEAVPATATPTQQYTRTGSKLRKTNRLKLTSGDMPQKDLFSGKPANQDTYPYPLHFGKRKALCIGVNYYGQRRELRGCVNDARNVRKFLINHQGFEHEDIVLLTEDSDHPRSRPTRANILSGMRWLVHDAKPYDSFFFHFSGHGGQVEDTDGDEIDGYDDVILPVDYKSAGYIRDDVMHSMMVKPLPPGCRFTALYDCCHSASALDLPYVYSSRGRLKSIQVSKHYIPYKSTPADVISWSACKSGQTSMDIWHNGVASGAMSYAFVTSLQTNPHQTYQELLYSIRTICSEKYNQKAQLSSSHRINPKLRFVI
ncbi:caspase domain-containing protein [Trametes elegans]|nr:caspase domain-containing protein [Trametes elegans]